MIMMVYSQKWPKSNASAVVYQVEIWTILAWKVPVCQNAFVRLKRVQKTKYPVYSGKNIQNIKWVSHGPSGNRHTKASAKAFLLAPSGASRAHRQHYRATVAAFLVKFWVFLPTSTVSTSTNSTSMNSSAIGIKFVLAEFSQCITQ